MKRRRQPQAGTIICEDCGALQRLPDAGSSPRAVCFRCGAVLVQATAARLDRALPLALGALVLFFVANASPLLVLGSHGQQAEVTLLGAVRALRDQQMLILAAVVLITTIILPLVELVSLAVLLLAARGRRRVPGLVAVLRVFQAVRPWAQLEILLLGLLVAFGKLVTVFHTVPGMGALALCGCLVLKTVAVASFDPRHYWRRVGADATPATGAPRPVRESLIRTAAFLIAAAILYLPANLLPVMTTNTLSSSHAETILSGVVTLWRAGSWALSLLVFGASIVVPTLKIAALSFLVISSWRGSTRWRQQRTWLYRWVELVGRWSMLDVFVMAVLAALVHSRLAGVEINAGAIGFAAVVVLTMLASRNFDPRLIWNTKGTRT